MRDSNNHPSADIMRELHDLRQQSIDWSKQIGAADRARIAAETAHRAADARADRAEHAERQIAADRDRWKRLVLAHEAELRSLRQRVMT